MQELFRILTPRVQLIWVEPTPPRHVAWLKPNEPVPGVVRVYPAPHLPQSDILHKTFDQQRDALCATPLFEHTEYDVEVEAIGEATRVELRHRDPMLLSRIRASRRGDRVSGPLNFRAEVGCSHLEVWADERLEFALEVEVFPTRMDYRSDVREMLAELEREAPAMAFAWLASTFRSAKETRSRAPSQLEWGRLLSDLMVDLERALERVARQPHRAVVREVELVRPERIRHPDTAVRRALCQGKGRGLLAESSAGGPNMLTSRQARTTLDSPEHRWLAQSIATISSRLSGMVGRERDELRKPRGDTKRRRRSIEELELLQRRVTRLHQLPPLRAATGPPPAGFTSLRLLQGEGYGEAWRACCRLDLALQFDRGTSRLSTQGLERLYEIWVWLRLVRTTERVMGTTADPGRLLPVSQQGIHLRVGRGRQHALELNARDGRVAKLTYNPLYTDHTLVPQQPDITVRLEAPGWPAQLLVLDAKYRIDNSHEHRVVMQAPAPPADALNVLYRYRDAILEAERSLDPDRAPGAVRTSRQVVVEAAAAYPYSPDNAAEFAGSRVWGSLERLGVGAIPLLPGDDSWLELWLQRTLGHGAWALADRASFHRSAARSRQLRRLERERVLVGIVPDGRPERLAWHMKTLSYYVPMRGEEDPNLLDVAYVALFSRLETGDAGAVRHYGRVVERRLVKRSLIDTPWAPLHASGESCVLYRVDGFQALESPVPNHPGRYPQCALHSHIWTTGLGLARASHVMELALESEPEWRLMEELSAAGVEARARCLDERPTTPLGPGRAELYGAGWVARFEGTAGFSVSIGGRVASQCGTLAAAIDLVRNLAPS